MSRKLTVLLIGLGFAAFVALGPELWWMRFFRAKPAPAPEVGWKFSIENPDVTIDARLGAERYLPGHPSVVPLRIVLQGRAPATGERQRLPLNIALVIDRSGSMEEEGRMEQVRTTVDRFLDSVQPGDRISLISYATGVTVHRASDQPLDVPYLRELVRGLKSGGGTSLHDGLEEGCRQVAATFGPGVNRVLLFSDGIANIGLRDSRQIVDSLAPYLKRGITITSIGVGADFNEDLLAELAERGRGNYYFIEHPTELAQALGQELQELGSVVARDPVLSLELPPGTSIRQIYGYASSNEDRRVTIPLKDLYAGESRKILVELDLDAKSDELRSVVRPILRYQSNDTAARSVETAAVLSMSRARDEADSKQNQDEEVAAEVLYTKNSLALTGASNYVANGQSQQAEAALNQAIEQTRSGAKRYKASPKVAAQLGELEQSLKSVQSADGAAKQKVAAKRMKSKARDYAKQ